MARRQGASDSAGADSDHVTSQVSASLLQRLLQVLSSSRGKSLFNVHARYRQS